MSGRTTGERRRSPPRAVATSASSWLQPVASMCTLYGLMRRVQGQRDSPLSPPCEPRRSWSRGRAPSYGGTVLAGVHTLHSFVELIPAFRPCPYVDLRLCAQKTAGTLLELRLRLSPQGPAWAKEREGSAGSDLELRDSRHWTSTMVLPSGALAVHACVGRAFSGSSARSTYFDQLNCGRPTASPVWVTGTWWIVRVT